MLGTSLPVLLASFLMALPTAPPTSKESREREAKRACLNGEVDVGVKILTDLYVDSNDATYIFNQGRCFEQSSRFEEAISRFREYLRKAQHTSEEDRADVQKHIADCESLMQKAREKADRDQVAPKSESTNPVALAPRPQPGPLVPPPASPVAVVAQEPLAHGTRGEGSGLRTGGLILASVGGAAVIAGVVLNLKYNAMTSDLKSNYYTSTDSSSHTYKVLSQTGYAVGAASVAAGALMYYLGWRAGRVDVVPAVVSNHAGAVLSGAF